MTGDTKAIDKVVKQKKSKFKITIKSLACTINHKGKTTYIAQPFLIKKMFHKFGDELPKHNFVSQGTPGFISHLKGVKEDMVLPEEIMSK